MNNNKAFSEVIESSLQGFVAQSWQWDTFPTFGSLMSIKTKKRTLIGLVHQIQTGSMDPARHPFAYQKTEEELLQEQPQIFAFLRTTFSCVIIGYQEKGTLHYLLAPEPAKIHAFVEPLADDVARQFLCSPHYLPVLFGLAHHVGNLDELLLALLRYQTTHGTISPETINRFAHTYSLLTGNDYRRLKLFLQRAQMLV